MSIGIRDLHQSSITLDWGDYKRTLTPKKKITTFKRRIISKKLYLNLEEY